MKPAARTEELLTQPVGDEVVVYDERTHMVHRLNATAAMVFRLCDGRRTPAELGGAINEAWKGRDGEDLVAVALDQLGKAGLLTQPLPALDEPISRRRLLATAAALIPVVASLDAPLSAQTPLCSPFIMQCTCTRLSGVYVMTSVQQTASAGGCAPPLPTRGHLELGCAGSQTSLTLTTDDRRTHYLGTMSVMGAITATSTSPYCDLSVEATLQGNTAPSAPVRFTLTETLSFGGACDGSVTYRWEFEHAAVSVPPPGPCSSSEPVTCDEVAGTDGSYFGTATRTSASAGCPSSPTENISVNVECNVNDLLITVIELVDTPGGFGRTTQYTCPLNPDGTFSGPGDGGDPGSTASGCGIPGGAITNGVFTRGTPNQLTFTETVQYSDCCTGTVAYTHVLHKAPDPEA